jgi:hypothetical protein
MKPLTLTTTLLLTLLVFGCAHVVPRPIIVQVSEDIDVLGMKYYGNTIQAIEQLKASENWEYLNKRVVERWEDLSTGYNLSSAEAMNIRTGKKLHIGNVPLGFTWPYKYSANELARLNCEILTKSECVNTRTNLDGYEYIYYKDLDDYFAKIKEREEKAEEDRLAAIEKERNERIALEKKEQDVFNKLYSTCLSYGFEERDSIASCIQKEIFNEKKLALLKQQQLSQIAYANQQKTQEQEETNYWLRLLEGLADHLSDPNTWENARQNAEIQKLKNRQFFR